MPNKETAKQWFQQGDYPTGPQFAQTMDWQRWKDEPIPIADVQGLQQLLNMLYLGQTLAIEQQVVADGTVYTWEGMAIHTMYLKPQGDCTISITTGDFENNEEQVMSDLQLFSNRTTAVNVAIIAELLQPKSIIFSGVTSPLQVRIFFHKI